MRAIDGFPNFNRSEWGEYDYQDVLRKVPGMYVFDLSTEFKIFRKGDFILKSSEETEEIIAEIPYKFILARYGASP